METTEADKNEAIFKDFIADQWNTTKGQKTVAPEQDGGHIFIGEFR